MASFELSIPKLLRNEGAVFVSNPETGEVSKYGITAFTLRDLGLIHNGLPKDKHGTKPARANDAEVAFVRSISPEYATWFYRKHFWDRLGLGALKSQELADKILDLAVNSPSPSAKALQHAINRLTFPDKPLIEDGVIGPKTIAAGNSIDPQALLIELRREMATTYRNIAANNPGLEVFLPAWLDRLDRG